MANHENLQAVGLFALVWLGSFFGFLALPQVFQPPLNVQLAVISTVIDLIAAVIYFSYKSRSSSKKREEPMKVDAKAPLQVMVSTGRTVILNLEPLPHYQGYTRPPSAVRARIRAIRVAPLVLKGIDVEKAPPRQYTNPDGRFLAESQFMTLYYYPPFSLSLTYIMVAKFGVIRVHSLSGNMSKCKAEIRVRVVEADGKAINGDWWSVGLANWYSPRFRLKFSETVKAQFRLGKLEEFTKTLGRGINPHLFNSEEDITQGQSKDLLLFYMLKDNPSAFMCTSLDYAPIGIVQNQNPIKFEVEITMIGRGYTTSVWNYRVTALWDDYTIVKV